MLTIYPVQAFRDNYIWVMHNENVAVVVDPGDASPVLEYINQKYLQLAAILVTHHHSDHTGGIAQLCGEFKVPVYGPHNESIPAITNSVKEGDQVCLPELSLALTVLETPGHTAGHVVYYAENEPPILFSGDTLFACGCGRIFEGTPEQMYQSLQKLANLPAETLVYSTHEYTLANMQFARMVEPGNLTLSALEKSAQQLRAQNQPTLPTTILKEKESNPFFRCDQPEVIQSACQYIQQEITDPVQVFAAIREWKNG